MIILDKLNFTQDEEIIVWGFVKCPDCTKGTIESKFVFHPLNLPNSTYDIECYKPDSFTIDYNNGKIIPTYREDWFIEAKEEYLKKFYGNNYYPLHAFYSFPINYPEEKFKEVNKRMAIFEQTINDFFMSKEEIDLIVKYIKEHLYAEEWRNK